MTYKKDFNAPEIFTNKDFIGVWDNIIRKDYCDYIINLMDNSTNMIFRNRIYAQDSQFNLEAFHPYASKHIMTAVRICLEDYVSWYPYLQNFSFHSSGCFLQKTEPMGGYHTFHSEDSDFACATRTLVWTVYFNDVEAGETEFLYQKQKVNPKQGRIVIFPGSFTHLHRGNPPYNNKYIATGWLASNNIGEDSRIL